MTDNTTPPLPEAVKGVSTAEAAAAELLAFALHVKKCIAKNGEYAPLISKDVDDVIAKATGATAAAKSDDDWNRGELWHSLSKKHGPNAYTVREIVLDYLEAVAAAPSHPPATPAKCLTCTGHGLIGGLLPGDGGYDSLPCPDCNAPEPAVAVQAEPVRRALEDFAEYTGEGPINADWRGMVRRIGRVAREALAANPKPAPVEAVAVQAEPARDRLIELIDQRLTSMYACGRVWEAWNVGTMSQDDFTPAQDTDFAADLADAILAAHPKPAAPATADEAASEAEISATINAMDRVPYGIGSRRVDAVAFARAILALRSGASAQPAEGGAT